MNNFYSRKPSFKFKEEQNVKSTSCIYKREYYLYIEYSFMRRD